MNLSRIPFPTESYEPFFGIYASWIAWIAAQEMHLAIPQDLTITLEILNIR